MTDKTTAMTELPEPELGYIETDKSRQPAFSARQMREALRPQADHPDTARCIKARNDLNAALHGEGALIDDLEHAVANVCAKLLRPQAEIDVRNTPFGKEAEKLADDYMALMSECAVLRDRLAAAQAKGDDK